MQGPFRLTAVFILSDKEADVAVKEQDSRGFGQLIGSQSSPLDPTHYYQAPSTVLRPHVILIPFGQKSYFHGEVPGFENT